MLSCVGNGYMAVGEEMRLAQSHLANKRGNEIDTRVWVTSQSVPSSQRGSLAKVEVNIKCYLK